MNILKREIRMHQMELKAELEKLKQFQNREEEYTRCFANATNC